MANWYSDEELLTIAKNHSIHFTTLRGWDIYAMENNLPRAHVYRSRFGSWNKAKQMCNLPVFDAQRKFAIQKKRLVKQLSPYKYMVTTASEWDEFAKDKGLPASHKIIHYFEKWNDFKTELGLSTDHEKEIQDKREKYIEIAIAHISEFSKSAESWKEYAKLNKLPSTNTYISNFGSWATAQLLAGVNYKEVKSIVKKHDKQYLIQVAQENISHFQHTGKWQEFAKTRNLPDQYAYIRAFGSMSAAKEAVGINDYHTRKNYKKDELIQIALNHFNFFTTQETWDEFARKHNLPRNRAYTSVFGSWIKSKEYIQQLYESL